MSAVSIFATDTYFTRFEKLSEEVKEGLSHQIGLLHSELGDSTVADFWVSRGVQSLSFDIYVVTFRVTRISNDEVRLELRQVRRDPTKVGKRLIEESWETVKHADPEKLKKWWDLFKDIFGA